MAHRNVRIAGNNARQQDLFLLQRIVQLRAELANKNVANRELEISIILHDLMVGSRRIEDLPREVLVDVNALVDQCIKSASDRLTEMAAALEPPAVAAAPAPSGGEPRQ